MSLPNLLTVPEAAAKLRSSESFVYEHQSDLGAIKRGRSVLIPETGIEDYLLERRVQAERRKPRRGFEPLSRTTENRLMQIVRQGRTR